MSASKPEKLLETIKNWIKEEDKRNSEEVYNPKKHFTLSLFSKEEDSGELPISVAYPKDPGFTNTILIGWAWRPSDIDINAYQSIKDINVRRDLIKSIKNKCNEKGLSISLKPYMQDKTINLRLSSLQNTNIRIWYSIIFDKNSIYRSGMEWPAQ